MSLNGKTALVTGASRGIGRAIALRLAEDGANVAVIYAGSADKAEAVVNEITALGVNAKAYRCNVADSAAVNETVKAVTNDLGKIDILVNNAGITRDGLMLRMKDEDFDAVLDTNLKGAFNMIRACYSGFIRKKSGRIINISSVSGIMGNAGQANYSASKAGVIGLTKSVARELPRHHLQRSGAGLYPDGHDRKSRRQQSAFKQHPAGQNGQAGGYCGGSGVFGFRQRGIHYGRSAEGRRRFGYLKPVNFEILRA